MFYIYRDSCKNLLEIVTVFIISRVRSPPSVAIHMACLEKLTFYDMMHLRVMVTNVTNVNPTSS